ncbi:hypothetical protein FRB96_001411 [Tulasnella sp. 330]|nr:hypothetical protein FRB96_001411 [Tulasnella sp. 330]KAG8878229.1 hypothetical protein FRB97_002687 [Tulasnella sp. 331]
MSLRDLLSLALTNSAIHDAIVPGHLYYRQIEPGFANPHLWAHLLQLSRRIIKHVRLLRLDDFTTESVPPCSHIKVDESATWAKSSTQLFPEALKRMSNLETVLWSRDLTVHDGFSLPSGGPDEFWIALKEHAPNLRELRVECSVNCRQCPTPIFPRNTTLSKIFELGGLQSLTLKLNCNTHIPHVYDLEPLCNMLSRCPGLNHLSLSTTNLLILDATLLTHCRLPNLKHLFLDRPEFKKGHSLGVFFTAHPDLRTLSIPKARFDLDESKAGQKLGDSLPNLRHVCGDVKVIGRLFLPLPDGRRRPLAYVDLIDGEVELPEQDFEAHEDWIALLMNELSQCTTLRSLCVAVHSGERQLTPQLNGGGRIRRLEIDCLSWPVWGKAIDHGSLNRLVSTQKPSAAADPPAGTTRVVNPSQRQRSPSKRTPYNTSSGPARTYIRSS